MDKGPAGKDLPAWMWVIPGFGRPVSSTGLGRGRCLSGSSGGDLPGIVLRRQIAVSGGQVPSTGRFSPRTQISAQRSTGGSGDCRTGGTTFFQADADRFA